MRQMLHPYQREAYRWRIGNSRTTTYLMIGKFKGRRHAMLEFDFNGSKRTYVAPLSKEYHDELVADRQLRRSFIKEMLFEFIIDDPFNILLGELYGKNVDSTSTR